MSVAVALMKRQSKLFLAGTFLSSRLIDLTSLGITCKLYLIKWVAPIILRLKRVMNRHRKEDRCISKPLRSWTNYKFKRESGRQKPRQVSKKSALRPIWSSKSFWSREGKAKTLKNSLPRPITIMVVVVVHTHLGQLRAQPDRIRAQCRRQDRKIIRNKSITRLLLKNLRCIRNKWRLLMNLILVSLSISNQFTPKLKPRG